MRTFCNRLRTSDNKRDQLLSPPQQQAVTVKTCPHLSALPWNFKTLLAMPLITHSQGWKPGYSALGCQFRCVETQMSGFSLGLVSRLLTNRFRFPYCLRAASVSGFQFKFHPRKLFYCELGLFKSFTSWRFGFITIISSSSDGRVRRAIASEVVDFGMIQSPVKPKTQKLVFTASLFDAQR